MAPLGPQTLLPSAPTTLSAAPLWAICSLNALDWGGGMCTASGVGPEWMQATSFRPLEVIWYVQPCLALLVPFSSALVQMTTASSPSLTTSCSSFCMA